MRPETGERGDSLSNLRRAVNIGFDGPAPMLSPEEVEEVQELLEEDEEIEQEE